MTERAVLIFYQTINMLFGVLAAFGGFLVIYGTGKDLYGWYFTPLDSAIGFISLYATLIGVIGFCLSLYLPPNPRPPMLVTKYISVPIILFLACVSLCLAIYKGSNVSEFVVRGVAIMGLAGVLIRGFVREL